MCLRSDTALVDIFRTGIFFNFIYDPYAEEGSFLLPGRDLKTEL
jgi:hypothetical protein